MSQVINNEGFKPGSIHRIALKNFVTYRQVVLFPGPSLNLIVGPNGTGKSTFICAIILGLCGKTSVIGRAKKISEYVQSGCEQATIEIELYQNIGQRNVIITRYFDLRDVSTWHIDHKVVKEKQVQDLIASLNIQVDNFCQLLPQDRVQDFSKMDPQQLLRSTLSAVSGQESVNQLDELINSRNEQKTVSTKLQNNAQIIEEQLRLNERLKVIIDTMEQRKEIEKQIEICEKKKLWLEYQELREKVIEYTNDKNEAVKLVTSHKSKIEPLEKVIDKAKTAISKLEQQKLAATREIHSLKEEAKDLINMVRNHEYSLKDIEAAYQDKLERHRMRKQELIEAKAKLDKLVTDKERLIEKIGDDTRTKMEMAEIMQAMQKTKAGIDMLKKQKLDIQYDLEKNIMPQIRLYQNRIRLLQDVDMKRLEVLRNYSEDAYQAVKWLRKNQEMFQHPVYEPMLMNINFNDPKFARYLESTVPDRDLVAFTFEDSDDMNLFLQKVRKEGGLRRVNAICSEGRPNIQKNNIQQISYLGFYTYLIDTITAPDPILKYLCKQYNIHKIPIGNDHTYKNSGKVPANITYFFTENHRFVVRVSAYSGVKSSSTIEIRPPRLLANTVDVEQLESFNMHLSNFEQKAQSYNNKLESLDQNIEAIEVTINELNTKRKRINDGLEKVKTISVQIRMQEQKVRDIENDNTFDIEKEKLICKTNQKKVVLKQCSLQEQLAETMKTLQQRNLDGEIWKFVVASAPLLASFSAGGSTTYPTVLLHQLRSNESSIYVDFETSTWIGSIHGLAGIPSILMPALMQWKGRRLAFMIASSFMILGWITMICAQSVGAVLTAESLQGFGSISVYSISMMSLNEMIEPRYRDKFMQGYVFCQAFMMTTNGILFQYLHWKSVALIMFAPACLSLVIAFIWPESPYWLAYKGDVSSCRKAFLWLRGSDADAKKELEGIICKQRKEYILNKEKPKMTIRLIWTIITNKEFYLPAMHMFILDFCLYWSGLLVFLVYTPEFVDKTTSNKTVRFCSPFIINSLAVCSIVCSTVTNKYIKRKTALLYGSSVMFVCLLSASLVTFLQRAAVLPSDSLLCFSILVLFILSGSFGVTAVTIPYAASLMPVKFRGIGGALFVLYTCLHHSSSLKIAPYLFVYLDMWGTYIVYAINVLIAALVIWKFVPDIDGRTLQEIESYYANGHWKDTAMECELIVRSEKS